MNILMISSYHYLLGGIERVVFETTKMLRENGHEVIPFAMRDPRNIPSGYEDFFVDQRDISKINFSLKSMITATKMIYNGDARKKLGHLLDQVKPDIAHVHHMYGRLTPSILYELKKRRIPVVMTLHDYKLICPNYKFFSNGNVCEKCGENSFYRAVKNRCVKDSYAASFIYSLESYIYKISKTYCNYVDTFIAPSKFMQQIMIEHGMDANKFKQIYNFLNLNDYKPLYQKNDYLLYFGRLTPEKGLTTLLDAMKTNKDIKLLIAGTGELENKLKERVRKDGLANVSFLGFKSGDELAALVCEARGVVVPSIWYENNPMVVLESFAYGTPVIGANIGGIPELIQPNVNGFLFQAGDSSDLAENIRKLFSLDASSIQYMGKAAREFIERYFSEQVHYDKLIKIYSDLL